MTTIVLITLAWLAVATLLAMFLGRVLRLRDLDGPTTEVCVEPGCSRPATHDRTVGVTTTAVPAGDPDGFSWVVERVCRRHGGVQ
jgi:hypothetical protein